MIQRRAKLAYLVVPAFVRPHGEITARHCGGSTRHGTNRVCHASRNQISRNHHANGGDDGADDQRAYETHERTVDFEGRPRHQNGADHALHVVLNWNANDNAIRRTPFCGNDLFASFDHLLAVLQNRIADWFLFRFVLRFVFGCVGNQVRLFIKDIDVRSLLSVQSKIQKGIKRNLSALQPGR